MASLRGKVPAMRDEYPRDPFPGRPFALVAHLEEMGFPRDSGAASPPPPFPGGARIASSSTASTSARDLLDAARHVQEGKLESVRENVESALRQPDLSTAVSTWSGRGGAGILEGSVRSHAPSVKMRLADQGFPFSFFYKAFSDPRVVLSYSHWCKFLDVLAREGRDVPRGEHAAYVTRGGVPSGILSISTGTNLGMYLRRKRVQAGSGGLCDPEYASLDERLHAEVLGHARGRLALARDPHISHLFAYARPERYFEKALGSDMILSSGSRMPLALGPSAANAWLLARRLSRSARRFMHQFDIKSLNMLVLEDSATLQDVDPEKAFSLLVHPSHFFAHSELDPAWNAHLDDGEAFSRGMGSLVAISREYGVARREEVFDAALYYLKRQLAVARSGVLVPEEGWEELHRARIARFAGYYGLLLEREEIRGRYLFPSELPRVDAAAFVDTVPFVQGYRRKRPLTGAGSS